MIKISYQNIPKEYFEFIDKFKNKVQKWYDKGTIGKGNTKITLCNECKIIFRLLLKKDNIYKLLLSPADKLPHLIVYIENRFRILKDDREGKTNSHSDLYECLKKAFYNLGYCDTNFPDFEITKALGIRACPYCNAEEIIVQDLVEEGVRIRSSELDHFYPKELFPYLAISLYNLVPSGSVCNGGNCKHNKDSYLLNLVNPFSLSDSDGLAFELDITQEGILSYDTFKQSCSIVTSIVNKSLATNVTTFLIESRYIREMDQVRKVWFTYQKYSSDGYTKEIERILHRENMVLTLETWFKQELDIDPNDYSKQKLSKLSMDIWRQLESLKI